MKDSTNSLTKESENLRVSESESLSSKSSKASTRVFYKKEKGLSLSFPREKENSTSLETDFLSFLDSRKESMSSQPKRKRLTGERDRLNAYVAERQREVEELKQRLFNYSEIEAKLRFITQERDKFSALLNERTQEVEKLRSRLNQLEGDVSVIADLKNRLARFSQDGERFKRSHY